MSGTGMVLGLAFGVGAVLLLAALTSPPTPRSSSRPRFLRRLDEQLVAAGLGNVGAARLLAGCLAAGFVMAVVVAGFSHSAVLGLAFGLASAAAPVLLVSRRASRHRAEVREIWPDVVDNLASAVRAGLSLPEALAQLGANGPTVLAPAFTRFAADYRTSGGFAECLEALKAELADPVADRIVESLRLAREVGGSDLGRLLRELSAFLREDARIRGELETRQGWTVNAARLAAAAPWLTLALLGLRPEAVAAYDTASGVVVLAVGAAVTFAAYRLMVRIGRLPAEARVLT